MDTKFITLTFVQLYEGRLNTTPNLNNSIITTNKSSRDKSDENSCWQNRPRTITLLTVPCSFPGQCYKRVFVLSKPQVYGWYPYIFVSIFVSREVSWYAGEGYKIKPTRLMINHFARDVLKQKSF